MCADNLFYVSRANIFSIYPKILRRMIIDDDAAHNPEKVLITLPSDFEWQLKCYFRLLEQQKKLNALEDRKDLELSQIEVETFDSSSVSLSSTSLDIRYRPADSLGETLPETFSPISPNADRSLIQPLGYCVDEFRTSVSIEPPGGLIWNLKDFAKAGKLLKSPSMSVEFYDEYEMRKVYSLIYDVFRFKLVLSKTLDSIEFFITFPELRNDLPRVWLLLYDLYVRKFTKRKPELLALKDELFKESQMLYIETCLDKMKTKLAASITKLRIQQQALNLQFLLPAHLRDEKVARAVTNPIISGWINRYKGMNKSKLMEKFKTLNLTELQSSDEKFRPRSYRFDKVCPGFAFIWFSDDKSEFSKDPLVTEQEIILQNKAFTIGPAIFAKLVSYYGISGDVLQTQILSPRSTAYLGCLLRRNKFVGKIRVFGAGEKFDEYQSYFDEIGASNIKLYAEKFIDFQKNILEKTVAIYCTPPSSFSSISDPIELICSRGGDLTMLQFLSESEMNDDGQARATRILEEQRESLKEAMSKPQIQFILYETHSTVEAENQDMVQSAMDFVNRNAYDKHYLRAQRERERAEQLQREKENIPGILRDKRVGGDAAASAILAAAADAKRKVIIDEKPTKSVKINLNKLKSALRTSMSSNESLSLIPTAHINVEDAEAAAKDEPLIVDIPPTDLFENTAIPDFCLNKDNCITDKSNGCFLSLIRRKEIVKMNSKYLIQVAELRGIFGDKDKPKLTKSKAQIRAERKQELAAKKAREALELKRLEKHCRSNVDKVIERLLKPTQATIIRFTRDEIWRRRYHIMTLRYNQLFPPRCARCDYYSQNYYFLADKFVTIKQFDDTLTLRFGDNGELPPFQESLTRRRAENWWKELMRYLKQVQMVSKLAGTELSLDNIGEKKSAIPPLKLVRFPRGYTANPVVKSKPSKDHRRQEYSLSIIILDIDQSAKRTSRFKSRIRSATPRTVVTMNNFNRCFLCLNEYLRITSGYQQMIMSLTQHGRGSSTSTRDIMKYVEMRFRGGNY